MPDLSSSEKSPIEKIPVSRYLLAAAPALIIGFAFGLGMILRDCSITCNVGYKFTPLAILAVGIAAIPVSSLTVRMSNRLGYRRWQILTLLAIASSFLIFWGVSYFILTQIPAATYPNSPSSLWTFPLGFVYLGYFIWLGAIGAAVKPNLKSTVYRLFPQHGREKALAVTTAAVITGGLMGASMVTIMGPRILMNLDLRYEIIRDSFLVLMAFTVLLAIPFIHIISRKIPDKSAGTTKTEGTGTTFPSMKRSSLRNSLHIMAANPQLKRISALILTTGMAEAVILFLFYWMVNDQVAITQGRALFFANFYIWLNTGTLLFLIFGTNRLINRLGLIFALAAMPFALIFGSAYLLIQSTMVAMYIVRITFSALEQSLYGQGIDRLILEVDESQAPQVRPILHGLAIRTGRGLGAILVIALALGAGISFTHMSVVFLAILFFWAGIAYSLRLYVHRSSLLSTQGTNFGTTE